MSLLISREDFKDYIHLTELIDSFNKILNWVNWVQENRLKPKLGDAFYADMIEKKDQAPYVEFIKLVKPYLVWRSMVQITKLNDYHFSSYGIVKKKNRETSEGISAEERRDLALEFQRYADDAEREYLTYLDEHKDEFELWKSDDDCATDDDKKKYNISIAAI